MTSTDQAYALPADTRTYRVGLAGDVQVPQVATRPERGSRTPLMVGAGGLAVAATLVLLLRRRRRSCDLDLGLSGVPIAADGLGKAYADGHRAVSDVTSRVEPGQVLGRLGPNGAGTTTLRSLLGLLRPAEGACGSSGTGSCRARRC